jgi:hypothetical protein
MLLPKATEARATELADELLQIIRGADVSNEEIEAVQSEINRFGASRRGDLLLIDTNKPRLGAVLPDHQSRTFSRWSSGDLAVSLPFDPLCTSSAFGGSLQVHEKARSGVWSVRRVSTCLGSCPTNRSSHGDPAVATASFLRFAAVRFATEGLFHSSGYNH